MDDLVDTALADGAAEQLNATVESVEIHEFQHLVEDAAVEPGGLFQIQKDKRYKGHYIEIAAVYQEQDTFDNRI